MHKTTPPVYLLSQESQPAGLRLGFYCRGETDETVSLGAPAWTLNEETPTTVQFTTHRGTKSIVMNPKKEPLGTSWHPTSKAIEDELLGWLEEDSDTGVTLRLPDAAGKMQSARFPGELGFALYSLRNSCACSAKGYKC